MKMPNINMAQHIVLIAHYFPPINSSGAKRMEAMAKYFARAGRSVTVITTRKSKKDGGFTERFPEGANIFQINAFGRVGGSAGSESSEDYQSSHSRKIVRSIKDRVMRMCGQLPDPRLPFSFAFLSPGLDVNVRNALQSADVVVATTPPWPSLLAAVFVRWRFRKPIVLDYRDHFSRCHEMPGGPAAKKIEEKVDRALAKRAAGLVVISEPMAEYYQNLNPRVATILNGFDPEVIDNAKKTAEWLPREDGSPLIVRYLGIITLGRIPRNLLAALVKLRECGEIDRSRIQFEYYGECSILEAVLAEEYPSLQDLFVFKDRVPYLESIRLAVTADYVFFCELAISSRKNESSSARGVLTTKLFEYLACGRPVLADISVTTLAGEHILKAGLQHIVLNSPGEFADLLRSAAFWNPGKNIELPFLQTLSRAAQAEEYLRELDTIIGSGTHDNVSERSKHPRLQTDG